MASSLTSKYPPSALIGANHPPVFAADVRKPSPESSSLPLSEHLLKGSDEFKLVASPAADIADCAPESRPNAAPMPLCAGQRRSTALRIASEGKTCDDPVAG